MKKLFISLLLLSWCLVSCTTEKIDVVILGGNDTIPVIENRLNLSINDTCIIEKHWINYFDGDYYRVKYSVVTKTESEQRLKAGFVWAFKGDPRERLVEGVSFSRGIVIAKY